MNFNQPDNYIDEYCSSEHYLFLNPESLKEAAPQILSHFFSLVSDDMSIQSLDRALQKMGNLQLEPEVKRNMPALLIQYFEYLDSSGKLPGASAWQKDMELLASNWSKKVREDGTVKGSTFVHKASETGRNEPCPCGSGKKFKKCCMLIL